MDYTGPITPEENAVFVKALQFLYGDNLAKIGFEANIRPTLMKLEEPALFGVPA